MEWVKVSIRPEESNAHPKHALLDTDVGLDSDSSSSHQRFFSDIPHMAEVIDNHENSTKRSLLPGIDSIGGYGSIKSFGERVAVIGAESIGDGLEIPLSKSRMEGAILEKGSTESGQFIRFVSPEKFGGRIESFKLPNGITLNEAFWDGDKLRITFNY